jgi:ubiquinone/menaquinone biosynthesis C-methylase UbiE
MTATVTPAGYALDQAWHAERERLDSLTSLYDPGTLALCDRLGVASGWHCLDVGAGTGSLASALAERVGPTGSVTALDVDTRFLEPLRSDVLAVVRADVTAESLPAGAFDLVHARLVLEHLPQRDQVLAALVEALRPGGTLLIEDFDWATALVVDPPSEAHTRVAEACLRLFSAHAYDPHFGRRLPRRLRALGLVDTGTRAESIQVWADRERGLPQWELLADQLAPGLLAAGLLDRDDLDAFHALWHDGETAGFAPLMVSSWGRRPSARQ